LALGQLEKDGLMLIEIVPRLAVEKNYISAMEFRPRIIPALKKCRRNCLYRCGVNPEKSLKKKALQTKKIARYHKRKSVPNL